MWNKIIARKEKGSKISIIKNLIVFILAKSCVFVAPLLLSKQLTLSEYGIFEYALSLALIISVFINIGIPASYPYYILAQKRVDLFPTFLLHSSFLFIGGIIYGILYFSKIISNNSISWVVCITLIVAGISFISTIYKTHSKTIRAVILDSIHYVFITLLCLSSYILRYNIGPVLLDLLWCLYFSLCVYFFLCYWHYFRFNITLLKNDYLLLIQYGFPAIITSLLISLIVGGGRIIIKYFLSEEMVGTYSFYYRLAAGIVLIHQFVSVTFFKKIFTLAKEKLDNYFCLFYAGLLIANIFLFFVIPDLLKNLFPILKDYSHYRLVYWIVSMQMVIWISFAMNENLIYRENLIKKVNIIFSIIILIGISSILLLNHWVTFNLEYLAIFHVSLIFISLESQYFLLKKNGLSLKKSRRVSYVAYILILISFFFLRN